MDTKCRLVGIDALGPSLAVTRPERPKDKVGVLGLRKLGKPVDTPFLPDPRSPIHMEGMVLLGVTGGYRLAAGKEALLFQGNLVKFLVRIGVSRHFTNPLVIKGIM